MYKREWRMETDKREVCSKNKETTAIYKEFLMDKEEV